VNRVAVAANAYRIAQERLENASLGDHTTEEIKAAEAAVQHAWRVYQSAVMSGGR